jgi:hypothetical protein
LGQVEEQEVEEVEEGEEGEVKKAFDPHLQEEPEL